MDGHNEASSSRSATEVTDTEKISISSSTSIISEEWKNLPPVLYPNILRNLPIATLTRFRLVCRQWNDKITFHMFPRILSQRCQLYPWFYTVDDLQPTLYDPLMNKWYRNFIPFIAVNRIVVTSAGGLLCLKRRRRPAYGVFNPLSGFFQEIPKNFIVEESIFAEMSSYENSIGRQYRLLFISRMNHYIVYDVKQNRWIFMGNVPRRINISRTVSIGSMIYFTDHPSRFVFYDTVRDFWGVFVAPSSLRPGFHLTECDGQVMTVGLQRIRGIHFLCIDQMDFDSLLWENVESKMIFELTGFDEARRLFCFGKSHLFFLLVKVAVRKCPGRERICEERVLIFDARRKVWINVPETELRSLKSSIKRGSSITFYPSL